MQKITFLFFLSFCLSVYAQRPFKTLKLKKYRVAYLEDELRENSGLNFFKGKLYTINDGGNSAEIFEINPLSGQIINRYNTGLKNFDWEAITSDLQFWYIGDIGNNWGTRTDLTIYQIPFQDQKVENITDLNYNALTYHYPDQKEFVKLPQNNNWDAESLIFEGGKLHIFTKEWQSYRTRHYFVNLGNKDKSDAQFLETFNLGYLATDAAYYEDRLYLVGYTKKMEVYLSVFAKDKEGLFFTQNPAKYYLGQASSLGQIEGIAADDKGIYISGEAFNLKILKVKPSLYFITWDKLK